MSDSREAWRDGAAIAQRSFEVIEAECGEALAALPPDIAAIARRLIHSTALTDLAGALAYQPAVAQRAREALAGGAPILADARMVQAGIPTAGLPADNPVQCFIQHPELAERAAAWGTTRSAAAVELWRGHMAGAVVAIGNAPTALFHLLDILAGGAAPPAAILAFPVGFVGAAESKEALRQSTVAPPFVTLPGRRGGSPMAAAAVNAVAALAREEQA